VELGGIEPPSGDAITSAFYMFRVRLVFGNGPALPWPTSLLIQLCKHPLHWHLRDVPERVDYP
ncbi:MAG: hypothetical protein RIT42_1546, partial [Bacteroidota bacterium]